MKQRRLKAITLKALIAQNYFAFRVHQYYFVDSIKLLEKRNCQISADIFLSPNVL